MNEDERAAEGFLRSMGYLDTARVEADPPDFEIGDSIGVEVRRFDQAVIDLGQRTSIATIETSLRKTVSEICSKYVRQEPSSSFWVFYRFRRPLPKKKKIGKCLKAYLDSVSGCRDGSPQRLSIGNNLTFELARNGSDDIQTFKVGASGDMDSCGWEGDYIPRNLERCIQDKEKDMPRWPEKYDMKWLLLVGTAECQVGSAVDEAFATNVNLKGAWDKIFVIDPIDFTNYRVY